MYWIKNREKCEAGIVCPEVSSKLCAVLVSYLALPVADIVLHPLLSPCVLSWSPVLICYCYCNGRCYCYYHCVFSFYHSQLDKNILFSTFVSSVPVTEHLKTSPTYQSLTNISNPTK